MVVTEQRSWHGRVEFRRKYSVLRTLATGGSGSLSRVERERNTLVGSEEIYLYISYAKCKVPAMPRFPEIRIVFNSIYDVSQ